MQLFHGGLAGALLAAGAMWAVPGAASAQDAIQVGAILPLTGASATMGEDQRRAIEMAVDEINASGGVLGKKYRVIIEDSGGNPTTALNAARKLTQVDKVPAVLGEFSSGISLPMGEFLAKEGIVHLNIASTSVKIRDLGENAFSLIGLEDKGNQFSSKDVWDLGYHKVGMFAPNNAYGQGVVEGFRKEFEKLGGSVVGEMLYTQGQSSYRRELQQLAKSEPDAYVYTAYGQEAVVINKEAQELGLRSRPFYAILITNTLSDTPADLARGQLGMEAGGLQGDVGAAYGQAYKERYGEPVRSSYNAYAHDGALLLAKAIADAGSTDPSAVRDVLMNLDEGSYVGVTGEIRFDQDGQRVDPPYDRLESNGDEIVHRQ